MSGITLTEVADATIPTPASGKVTVYFSTEEAGPAWKDDAAAVTALQGATGATGATGAGYGGTSTTSLAIGTGSKVFTTQAGLAYLAGARVRATSDAAPTADYMEGVCTAYTGTTLTITMDLIGGSGTHTDWSLNIAGDQGIQGDGVPPTVVAHGAMGATETFDYGDGPAHEGTVDAALTVTLTGWVAGECIMSLGFTTDGTGGYGVPTFGAEVVNDADLAAVWDDTAGAYNLIVLRTVDSGTTAYIAGLPDATAPDLDAVIAVSSGQDIADALSGAAAPTAANVFATMADVAAPVPTRCGAQAYRNGAVQAVNTTSAALTLDTEVFDTDGFWEGVTNPTRMTIPAGKGGLYLCTGTSFGSAAGISFLGFKVGGAVIRGDGSNKPDAAAAYVSCSAVIDLAAAAYVELWVGTSANINLGHASVVNAMTTFTVVRLTD